MAMKAAASYTFEITEEQRNLMLNGLVEQLLDTRRYLFDSEATNEPGPLDSCCDAHLQRYELRRDHQRILTERKQIIEATIELLSVEDAANEPEGSTA